jgi:hypothetical protein
VNEKLAKARSTGNLDFGSRRRLHGSGAGGQKPARRWQQCAAAGSEECRRTQDRSAAKRRASELSIGLEQERKPESERGKA